MSYNDEQFLKRLDDPLAEDIALDHEITSTIINIKQINERQRMPTTPLVTEEKPHSYTHHTISTNNSRRERMQRRLDYELLNQFLLYCELGHILHVEKMLKHPNIDIDYMNSRGHTPAMVAIIHNQTSRNTSKLVELLFKGGADSDITDYDGQTVFNYACDRAEEQVLYTLIRCGINTYHNLLKTLSIIQEKGLLNILYTLIIHFAIEKEFKPRCGACNHELKQEQPLNKTNKTLKCCIGNKLIKQNEIYYKCGSKYGCWGQYICCNKCYEYGILKFMIDITRTKKYNSLNKKEKYEVDKHIKKSNLQNPLNQKKKHKGIHFYEQYPNHYDQNIHSPIDTNIHSPNQQIIIDETLDLGNNTNINTTTNAPTNNDNDNNNNDNNDSSDDDSSDDSDSDSEGENNDVDEAPNFKQGTGLKFMKYILTKEEYWYGKIVLNEKEWREIYWMDIDMQLKWLIMLRRKVFDGVRTCLEQNKTIILSKQIIDYIMEMICGTNKVKGCFFV